MQLQYRRRFIQEELRIDQLRIPFTQQQPALKPLKFSLAQQKE